MIVPGRTFVQNFNRTLPECSQITAIWVNTSALAQAIAWVWGRDYMFERPIKDVQSVFETCVKTFTSSDSIAAEIAHL